ncbi:hypothetical protein [Streptomyces sp. NPDC006551]|uniref:DUF6841 family protein n=1 Tax=Streptomyces sp. NPDC006551 TaxID=3157178 RepID=UPI0033AC1531
MAQIDLAVVENEAKAWFYEYVETFIALAAQGSTDPEPLLDHFSVQISMTTGTAHTVLTSVEALSPGADPRATSAAERRLRGTTLKGCCGTDPTLISRHDPVRVSEPVSFRRTVSVAHRGEESGPAARPLRALLRGGFGRA